MCLKKKKNRSENLKVQEKSKVEKIKTVQTGLCTLVVFKKTDSTTLRWLDAETPPSVPDLLKTQPPSSLRLAGGSSSAHSIWRSHSGLASSVLIHGWRCGGAGGMWGNNRPTLGRGPGGCGGSHGNPVASQLGAGRRVVQGHLAQRR